MAITYKDRSQLWKNFIPKTLELPNIMPFLVQLWKESVDAGKYWRKDKAKGTGGMGKRELRQGSRVT